MTTTSVAERVKRGVELLDNEYPGWEHDINWDTFDIASPCFCVLGQIFVHYNLACDDLQLSDIDAIEQGFDVYPGESFKELQIEWLKHKPV